jgi:hypothetical protein
MAVNMNTSSAFQSGVQGLQSAQQGISKASRNIAAQSLETPAKPQPKRQTADLQADQAVQQSRESRPVSNDMVRLAVEQRNAEASLKTIETADAVIGSLIDTSV